MILKPHRGVYKHDSAEQFFVVPLSVVMVFGMLILLRSRHHVRDDVLRPHP